MSDMEKDSDGELTSLSCFTSLSRVHVIVRHSQCFTSFCMPF
jgi:hypothetical protein